MDDLVQWLHAQLDEDERIAQAAPGPVWEHRQIRGDFDESVVFEDYIALGDPDRNVVVFSEVGPEALAFALRLHPARVLREIDAKRQIIAAYLPPGGDPHPGLPCTDDIEGDPNGLHYAELHPAEQGACVRHLKASERLLHHDYVLRLLALPYADRPGYREEWRP